MYYTVQRYKSRYIDTGTDGDIRTKIEVQEKHKKRNRNRQIIKTGTNRDSGTAQKEWITKQWNRTR